MKMYELVKGTLSSVFAACLLVLAGCSSVTKSVLVIDMAHAEDITITSKVSELVRVDLGEVLPKTTKDPSAAQMPLAQTRIGSLGKVDVAFTDVVSWANGIGREFAAAQDSRHGRGRYMICRIRDPQASNPSLYAASGDTCRLVSVKRVDSTLEVVFAHVRVIGQAGAAGVPVDFYLSIDTYEVASLGYMTLLVRFMDVQLPLRKASEPKMDFDVPIPPIVVQLEGD